MCKVIPLSIPALMSSESPQSSEVDLRAEFAGESPQAASGRLVHWNLNEDLLRRAVQTLAGKSGFPLTVDLVVDAETFLNSIAEFAAHPFLFNTLELQMYLQRYELYLRLLAATLETEGKDSAESLVPPVDVAHVWRAHLIRPTLYRKDCIQNFQRVLPCSVLFSAQYASVKGSQVEAERASRLSTSVHKWEAFAASQGIKCRYQLDMMEMLPAKSIGLTVAHLEEDIKWWEAFQYWRDEYEVDRKAFLEKRLASYLRFLQQAAVEMLATVDDPSRELSTEGPPVDVDLMWHCHMLHPEYDYDLRTNIGFVFYHRPQADPECENTLLE